MQICLPFNKSSLQGRELEFIFQTISNGQIAGDQTFSKKCHGLLEEVVGGAAGAGDDFVHAFAGDGGDFIIEK